MDHWVNNLVTLINDITHSQRIFIGPLPHFFCFFKTIIRSCFVTQLFLYIDAISVIKYIFIFWLKNPAAFRDEFWIIFINAWIKGFGFIYNFVWFFKAEHQIINFYICTGKDPTEDLKKPLIIYNTVEISSIVLQILVSLRIKFYKFQTMNEQERSSFKNSFLFDVSKQSLATLSTMSLTRNRQVTRCSPLTSWNECWARLLNSAPPQALSGLRQLPATATS